MSSKRRHRLALPLAVLPLLAALPAQGQEARRRWDQMCQIRKDKLDLILPEAMRENRIDMWIVASREGHDDPNAALLGGGYVGDVGYHVFTDRAGSGRIERAAMGIGGAAFDQCPLYDLKLSPAELRKFVEARDPRRIGIDIATEIGTADGLSHSLHAKLVETLGPALAERLVSAEKLVSDFRSRHSIHEIAAFARAGEYSRTILERALSNEVIVPGHTTTGDVAWWMMEQLHKEGLGSSFGLPSIYVLGPGERGPVSGDHVIQPGDLITVDWGVNYLFYYTDMKRMAYVLKPGENAPPPGVQRAYDKAQEIRRMILDVIRPGVTAGDALAAVNRRVAATPGLALGRYDDPSRDMKVSDVVIGSHSVGDWGHGSGPSIADFNPLRMTYTLRPGNFLSIELFLYTPVPEWGARKIKIPLEDNGVVTERGFEWAYPPNSRILLVK
ncbi:M24 family metallopeptidase [Sphingomonas sp. CBMAI 2297]|uniref:M24 family metallopeptidase n=1 Tax=Sphingomonas sp. CBMAI 2297 TaxID=2991720 RepID=UPI002453F3BB|nr:M24 family metallopeptidase [Sphingomonas sp. CBMAI 2297]MDH4746559.1 M24 family metallopeptidase [Sphingomonas sp. CBMAI 2297]